MEYFEINTDFEYKIPGTNNVVNISDTMWKQVLIASLRDGSSGISNFECSVSGKRGMLLASEELERQFNPYYENEF